MEINFHKFPETHPLSAFGVTSIGYELDNLFFYIGV